MVLRNVFQRFKDVKMEVRPLLEDVITFFSIIGNV